MMTDRHPGDVVAAASHGNAIALFINSIDASFGHDDWAQMENPHVYRFERSGGAWRWLD